MESTPVRWEWPSDGLDPFDPSPLDTHWVLIASGDWGRAWPAGDLRGFGGFGDFVARVPMGYKAVLLVERLAILSGAGEWTWEPTEEPTRSEFPYPDGYHLLLAQGRGTAARAFGDAEAAMAAGSAAVQEDPGSVWMVARLLRHQSWH